MDPVLAWSTSSTHSRSYGPRKLLISIEMHRQSKVCNGTNNWLRIDFQICHQANFQKKCYHQDICCRLRHIYRHNIMFSINKKKNNIITNQWIWTSKFTIYKHRSWLFFYGGNLATWQVNILARSSSILLATYGNFHWSQKYVILFWIWFKSNLLFFTWFICRSLSISHPMTQTLDNVTNLLSTFTKEKERNLVLKVTILALKYPKMVCFSVVRENDPLFLRTV